jgi:lysophospholipase L1-like esterase
MSEQRRGIFRRVILIILAPVFIFLLVEVVFRVYFNFFGTEADRYMYVYSAEQIVAAGPAVMGLPFVNSGPSPRYPGHNTLGFRGPEITLPKPEGVFRILANGGSTTYGSGLEPSETWPAQLQQILHDEYGYTHVEVINVGSVGYTTWNAVASFAFRELNLEPDLLMVYHGTNDTKALTLLPECYQGQSVIRGLWNGGWRENGPPISPSVAIRFIAVNRGWMPNPADYNNWVIPVTESDPACQGTLPIGEALETNPPIYFERNLRNLVYLARGNGVDVMFSTWAYYPPKVENDAWEPAYDVLNAATMRVAEELDVPLYDLMGNMPDNPEFWYFDGEHQTVSGAHEQAAEYAAMLVDEGIIPPPES